MSTGYRDRTHALDTLSSQTGDPATRRRILEAALRLVLGRRGADVTLADVARAAHVSRQALYLHFADRAELLLALVRYADEQRGLPAAIQRIEHAASGISALREMAAMQAKMNPTIWPLARLVDIARRHDKAAERSWRDRLGSRRDGCRAIVARLENDGALRRGLNRAVAADLLWTLTSLQTWEDLVLFRGWTAKQYQARLTALLLHVLVRRDASDLPRRRK
jgi:AcrR family transcriptional regulator